MGRSVTPVCSIVMVTIIADQPITGNAVGAADAVVRKRRDELVCHFFRMSHRDGTMLLIHLPSRYGRMIEVFTRGIYRSPRLRLAAIQNRADHLG